MTTEGPPAPPVPASSTKTGANPAPAPQIKDSGRINVFCRFRPRRSDIPEDDEDDPDLTRLRVDEDRSSVAVSVCGNCREYYFDGVLGPQTPQDAVFNLVEPLVNGVLDGFNGTCLAYGQTSSGKTFTMEGTYGSLDDELLAASAGVIPRAAKGLFAAVESRNLPVRVRVSFVEIYNEKVRDLLRPEDDNLRIVEDPEHGVMVSGVREVQVEDATSVLGVLNQGKINRTTAATLMNAHSSRAHSILVINVQTCDDKTGRKRKAKLTLVDLAGSEKVSKTGAKGQRLKEAQNINRSLTTLGMVITALSRGYRHVPYRDSKLTRLLSESLGGNSRTVLLTCVAPESIHAPETISTLRFGESAKKITNRVSRNEVLTVEELALKLRLARAEIRRLRKQLGLPLAQSNKTGEEEESSEEFRGARTGIEKSLSDPHCQRRFSELSESSSEGDDEDQKRVSKHRISEDDVAEVRDGEDDAKDSAIEKEAETQKLALPSPLGNNSPAGCRNRLEQELVRTVVDTLDSRLAEREKEVFDQAQEIDRLETENAELRAKLGEAKAREQRIGSLQTMDWAGLLDKAIAASERAARAEEQLESTQEENSEVLERLLKQNAQLILDKDKLRRENWSLSQKIREQSPSPPRHRRSQSHKGDMAPSPSWNFSFFRPVLSPKLSPKNPLRQRSQSPKIRRSPPKSTSPKRSPHCSPTRAKGAPIKAST